MSALRDGRDLLAADLAGVLEGAGIGVYATVPEALDPPCVVIQAAEGFLSPGDTFAGEWAVSYDLILCVDLHSNAQAIEDLEDHLTALLAALETTEYGVDTVGRPGPVHTLEWIAHAVTVTASRYITL